MAEYSRVKKYENLRKEIENEKSVSGLKQELKSTVKGEIKSDYTPVHRKNYNNDIKTETNDSTFKNEYLDNFIQEVREYNIQKGIRESEDTKLDILQQLSSKNREKRANYLHKIEDEVVLETSNEIEEKDPSTELLLNEEKTEDVNRNDKTIEISKQVFELLNGNTSLEETEIKDEKVEESAIEKKSVSSLDERIAQLEQEIETKNMVEEEDVTVEEISDITKKELMEQTLELKAKVESYKEELSEINSDVSDNNRLLNIIILVLVFALLAVIGVVVYWLISGGII